MPKVLVVEDDDSMAAALNDGFRYVIVHRDGAPVRKALATYFTATPRFADKTLSLYALSDLQSAALCR